jgi:23S rRNA (adenine2503-C2)-methyltransferase
MTGALSPPSAPLPNWIGAPREELEAQLQALGEPAFRARQILRWIYHQSRLDFAAMSNLPAALRTRLAATARLELPTPAAIQSAPDGTEKLLFRFADSAAAEAVIIPDSDPESDRTTLCISSQAGCALACAFCQTGQGGAGRNLHRAEIVGQILAARIRVGDSRRITSLVFMGMGEPLLNLGHLLPALRLISDPLGLDLAPRRITISTAGIIPGIQALAAADLGVGLAISLTAPSDALRDTLMPINRRYPIARLLAAAREFMGGDTNPSSRRAVTFEYVLLPGVNDAPEHAEALGRLIAPTGCKINLIPHNPVPDAPYARPSEASLLRFQEQLRRRVRIVTVRWSRGGEVAAACGQLGARRKG